MKYKNTLQKGSVRYLVFKDGTAFFGVALEPDPEYEKMWQEYQDRKRKEKYEHIINGLPIFSGGWMELAKV